MSQNTLFEKDVESDPGEHPTAPPDAPRRRASEKSEKNGIIVEWDGPHDPENPQNWSTLFKCWVTLQLGMLAFGASLASSIISPANRTIAAYIGVSENVVVLNVSLYVIGFAFGPLIWAPLSEVWGRRVSMLPAALCLAAFSVGTALGRNAQTVFITRFFAGFFGSAAVSNVNAALGDIWSREARGTAVCLYGLCVVGGPTLGKTLCRAPSLPFPTPDYF
jgi:predicted MFS family arabinose efflux permease